MMTYRVASVLITLSAMGLCALARGQSPCHDGPTWCQGCARVPLCCPDDYVSKLLPSVIRAPCGCGDDYCPKPMPAVCRSPKGCVNDYCPKPCPVCTPLRFLGWI